MLKLSDLATLNAMKPVSAPVTTTPVSTTTTGATPSTVTNYTGFGELNPLLGDLVTTQQAPNSFMRSSYTYDPTAVENKLNTYSALSDADYAKYSPLLSGMDPALHAGGNYMFDKTALESQLGKYSSLSDPSYAALLGDLKGTTVGDQTYYDKSALSSQLGKYSGMSADNYAKYSPLLGDLTAIEAGGARYFDPTALTSQLGKYSTLDDKKYADYAQLLAKLNPTASIDGQNYFTTDALTNQLNKYSTIDPTLLTGTDAITNALKGRLKTVGDQSYIDAAEAKYYQGLSDAVNKSRIGYYGMNSVADPFTDATYDWRYDAVEPVAQVSLDGKSYNYIPYELASRIQGNTTGGDGAALNYFSDFLGNDEIFKRGTVVNLPENVINQIMYGRTGTKEAPTVNKDGGSWFGTDWKFDNPGLGYLMSQDDFNNYVMKSGKTEGFDADTTKVDGNLKTGHGKHYEKNLIGSFISRNESSGPYGTFSKENPWIAQSSKDKKLFSRYNPETKQWDQSAYDVWQEGGGGFFGGLGGVLDAIAPILAFTPLAPVAAAYTMGKGLGSGNIGQIIGGGLGAFGGDIAQGLGGAEGQSLGSVVGGKIGAGTGALGTAVGNSLIGAGSSVLTGNSLGDALKSGAIGGLSSYGGSLLGGSVNSALKDSGFLGNNADYSKLLSGAVGNLGATGINALLRGGDLPTALKNSLINSAIGTGASLAGRQLKFTPKG